MKIRSKQRPGLVPTLLIAVAIIGFNACARSASDSVEVVEIDECAEYSAAFRACAQKLGAGADAIVARQAASLRFELAGGVKDEDSRSRFRQACVENARLVREACR